MRPSAWPPNALRQPAVTEALAQVGWELELEPDFNHDFWESHDVLFRYELHDPWPVTDHGMAMVKRLFPGKYAHAVRGESS